VAVVATLSKGYDLDYIWKQVDRGPAKDAASYYIQASQTGGEPPGRWWGPGARALGFEPGQTVEREAYYLLFGERKAPDGTRLGRAPDGGRKAADLYAGLLAAEPHATAERKRELRAEAVRKTRQSPLFFDLTISLSKSISIFHASLGENARLARQAGDRDGDAYWSGLVGEVDEMIWQAVHAGFGYFQREAGYTRTGSHGTRVHGRETGQWHQGHLRRDDAGVLFPPRIDHGGPARPRRAVRAAVRPRAVPARARAPRAGLELHNTRKKEGALDVAQLHAGWADKLARTLGVPLASVAPSVWHGQSGHGGPRTRGADGAVLTGLELARAAQQAVALAQQEKSAWTRAGLIKYLGRVLPRTGRDPAAAAALLEDLAERALASEFEPVTCLGAPELADAPASLLRADGRSVHQRHGGARYATRAQLAMEERMAAHARAVGATRRIRARAAGCARTRPPARSPS
jgi:hypothetical protein